MPACADDLDLADSLELVTQLVARKLLIVDDQDFETLAGPLAVGRWQLSCHALIGCTVASSGTSMRARVPLPGSLDSFSW